MNDDQLSPIDGVIQVNSTGHVARVLPPEFAPDTDVPPILSDDEKLAALAVADRTRAQLAERSLNLDHADRPHFLRNVGGVETCGQDGQPWPCPTWMGMEARERDGQLAADGPDQLPPVLAELVRSMGGVDKVRELLDRGER
jgi:hypothetical protein